MKLRGIAFVVLVVVLLTLTSAGCKEQNTDSTTTANQGVSTDATTNSAGNQNGTTQGGVTQQTTVQGGTSTTTDSEDVIIVDPTALSGEVTTTSPSGNATTTAPSGGNATTSPSDTTTGATLSGSTELVMKEVSVNGLPVIVGNTRNRIKVSAAGVLNGNTANPMYILVTNVGEDDIYSATLTATAGGKEISFNISYLPRGGSVWAESVDQYKYNADDKFILKNEAVVVTATAAGVPIDRNYDGILRIYSGIRNGGRGIFIENVSGKKISKVIVKYRPVASDAGLYSAPSQVIIKDFESGATAFKANSYLYNVDIVDVQISY